MATVGVKGFSFSIIFNNKSKTVRQNKEKRDKCKSVTTLMIPSTNFLNCELMHTHVYIHVKLDD